MNETLKIFILLTLLYCLLFLKKNETSFLLKSLLVLANVNGVIIYINKEYIYECTNLYILFSFLCWFLILIKLNINSAFYKYQLILFFTISLVTYFYIPLNKFNRYVFVFGSLLYLLSYLYDSIYNLRKENLDYFRLNNFILISSPVLFFLGMSFLFGFKNKSLNDQIVFFGLKLFDLIMVFVNIIYYTLINIYIYKERKLNA